MLGWCPERQSQSLSGGNGRKTKFSHLGGRGRHAERLGLRQHANLFQPQPHGDGAPPHCARAEQHSGAQRSAGVQGLTVPSDPHTVGAWGL